MLASIDPITGSDTEKVPRGRYSNWSQNKAAVETAAAASAGTHTRPDAQPPSGLAPRNRHKMSSILDCGGREPREKRRDGAAEEGKSVSSNNPC